MYSVFFNDTIIFFITALSYGFAFGAILALVRYMIVTVIDRQSA